MAKRRRSVEEHENLERWLVSYADFITLLFAFFVVMYSISSVNEGKYRVLSRTLAAAFTDAPDSARGGDPIRLGKAQNGDQLIGQPDSGMGSAAPAVVPGKPGEDLGTEQARLENVANQVAAVLSPYIQDDLVEIKRHEQWLEVEMKSGLLFASGRAELAQESLPILYRMSEIFCEIPNPIHVEGHTDNLPISTSEFPSNWLLSSARAAAVVNQLMKDGVDPQRLAAIGYGEFHPVADNGTDEGRYRNRRVVLVIMSTGAARYPVPDSHPARPATVPPAAAAAPATPAAAGSRAP